MGPGKWVLVPNTFELAIESSEQSPDCGDNSCMCVYVCVHACECISMCTCMYCVASAASVLLTVIMEIPTNWELQ